MSIWTATAAIALAGGMLIASQPQGEPCLAKYATDLRSRTRNQRHNAILAAQFLDGAVVGPGEVLSFNGRVGSWSRDVGYRKAPVSYNGQLVPSWGGGVCQTSTTLYNAALLAGLEVVDRSPHRFATGYCPPGRDSAVAFGGIDLKLRNPYPYPLRVEAKAERSSLVVAIYGRRTLRERPRLVTEIRQMSAPTTFYASQGNRARVRNTGKPGFEVATYRTSGARRELISVDSYPVVHRIIEWSE
jgi:vancomycin resistance protein YoaR